MKRLSIVTIRLELISGVYCIKNIVNGKVYIGSTQDLEKRFLKHFGKLRGGVSHNQHMQNSYNSQAGLGFIFGVLEYCDIGLLEQKEQEYIIEHRSNVSEFGYNKRVHCSSNRGFEQTDYMKNAIRKRMTGRVVSEETRQKLRDFNIGRKLSEETKEKLRKPNLTEDQLKKMSDAKKGKPANNRKLTKEQAGEIRISKERSRPLGLKYGVSKTVILKIKSGEYYAT